MREWTVRKMASLNQDHSEKNNCSQKIISQGPSKFCSCHGRTVELLYAWTNFCPKVSSSMKLGLAFGEEIFLKLCCNPIYTCMGVQTTEFSGTYVWVDLLRIAPLVKLKQLWRKQELPVGNRTFFPHKTFLDRGPLRDPTGDKKEWGYPISEWACPKKHFSNHFILWLTRESDHGMFSPRIWDANLGKLRVAWF